MTEQSAEYTDYLALIAEVCAAAERQLQEARMSLHILLTAQFGELNDNQEEMAGAAAGALEEVGQELQRLRTIVAVDQGTLQVARESIHVGDMFRSLTPMLQTQADKVGLRLIMDVAPGLPRVRGDPSRLRDALRLTLGDDIRYSGPGSTVTVQARSTPSTVVITAQHGTQRTYSTNLMLADRLLRAMGGTLEHTEDHTTISIPRTTTT